MADRARCCSLWPCGGTPNSFATSRLALRHMSPPPPGTSTANSRLRAASPHVTCIQRCCKELESIGTTRHDVRRRKTTPPLEKFFARLEDTVFAAQILERRDWLQSHIQLRSECERCESAVLILHRCYRSSLLLVNTWNKSARHDYLSIERARMHQNAKNR